ncbi:hypothetical protein HYQ46_005817 [Verticillium longisporum]|nr:hypothetical protein HYQ46_005817 [Verticillium longisporum]
MLRLPTSSPNLQSFVARPPSARPSSSPRASINLPGEEGGSVEDNLMAAGKREELRQAMRSERKRKIKESNYLKSIGCSVTVLLLFLLLFILRR